jgi:hypothetical protein
MDLRANIIDLLVLHTGKNLIGSTAPIPFAEMAARGMTAMN